MSDNENFEAELRKPFLKRLATIFFFVLGTGPHAQQAAKSQATQDADSKREMQDDVAPAVSPILFTISFSKTV
ncbi:MAG: hypothetical protein Q9222_004650 [Ikaeria aurantiellina]